MKNHKVVLSSRGLAWMLALVATGGCQLLFGVDADDLPGPDERGAGGAAGGAAGTGRGGNGGALGHEGGSGAGEGGSGGSISGTGGSAGTGGVGGTSGINGAGGTGQGVGGQGGTAGMCAKPTEFPQVITCSGKDECLNDTITCTNDGRPCQINCTGETSCENATIRCPADGDCQLVCSGDRSCHNVRLECGTGYCEVVCRSNANTCDDMQDVDCSDTGTCLVTCEASMNSPPNAVLCGPIDHPSGCPCTDATCL